MRIAILIFCGIIQSCAHHEVASSKAATLAKTDASNTGPDPYFGTAFDESPLRWKLIAEKNGIKLYRDIESAPGHVDLRAKTLVNASMPKIASGLIDYRYKKRWLPGLVDSHLVKPISDYQRIEYLKLNAHYPFQFTDFVYRTTFSVIREPRTLLIRMSSINDPEVPLPEGTVRGEVTHSYDFVRQVDADHAALAIEMGLDPKGAFPSWESQGAIVAWFFDTLVAFKDVVEDPKFKVSAEVTNYMKAHKL